MRRCLGEIADTRDTDGYIGGREGPACGQKQSCCWSIAGMGKVEGGTTFIDTLARVSVPPLRLNTAGTGAIGDGTDRQQRAPLRLKVPVLPPLGAQSQLPESRAPPFWVKVPVPPALPMTSLLPLSFLPLASVVAVRVRRIADPEVIHIDRAARDIQRAVDIERAGATAAADRADSQRAAFQIGEVPLLLPLCASVSAPVTVSVPPVCGRCPDANVLGCGTQAAGATQA